MQRGAVVARVVTAWALMLALAGCGAAGDDTADTVTDSATATDDTEPPELEVVFGDGDALPDVLAARTYYRAAFTVEWKGGVIGQRDGILRVYASRQGNTSEDAPEDEWPLICENEFDDVVSVARLPCHFETPGPGILALQLEVTSKIDDKVIGEGLYTHNVVNPDTQESDE